MGSRADRLARLRLACGALGALAVIAAASWPLVFSNATFNPDWLNHLWYMWHQSVAIREHGTPGLYLNYSGGVLYPLYAFYGGTLYALVGTLSLILGDAPLQTYVFTYLLGFAAAYGGWYWIARTFGVRGWQAHIPGVVFVTSAYYLTMIYALGDWPAFLATSTMPLLIAAALSVLRARSVRFWPALALAASSVVFFGSHLLTVIWGSSSLIVVAAAILAFVPGARASLTKAGVLRAAALIVPAGLVSAWFLLPAVAYESHTAIALSYAHYRVLLRQTMFASAARHLFTFSRPPITATNVPVSLPILAIVWVLASAASLAWAGRRGTWLRVLAILALATVALGVVMTHAGLILALPRVYSTLQFSFRLESFLLLGISGAMVAALALARDAGPRLRRLTWLLVPVALVAVIGAIEQADAHLQGESRGLALSSYSTPLSEEFGQRDYVDAKLPIDTARMPAIAFPLAAIAATGRATQSVRVPPGRLVATNLRAGPEFAAVTGARIVALDERFDDVLEVRPRASAASATKGGGAARSRAPRTASISVAAADRLPVVAGAAISAVAAIVLLGELAWIAVGAWRGRAGGRTRSPRSNG
jgi:hypothetical protein